METKYLDIKNLGRISYISEKIIAPVELIQPIHLTLCQDKLDRFNEILSIDPTSIWDIIFLPLNDGKYVIVDGHHTAYDLYKKGNKQIPMTSFSLHPKFKKISDRTDLLMELDYIKKELSEIPNKVDFVRENGIYQLSDLEGRVIKSEEERIEIEHNLYISWKNTKGLK